MALAAEKADEESVVDSKKGIVVVTKTSSEILSELFGAFDAEPPSIGDEEASVGDDAESAAKHSKHKKHKKKSKHKKKKKKKLRKGRSSSDSSDSESKKSKHKKRKRKHSEDSDAAVAVKTERNGAEPPVKREKLRDEVEGERRSDPTTEIPVPGAPDLSKIKLPEDGANDKSDKSDDRAKSASGKIQIKNLKFSSVFEETVKQVEEERRKKAEKYEDGELSESPRSNDDSLNDEKPSSEEGENEAVGDLRNKLNNVNGMQHEESRRSDKHGDRKEKDSHRSHSESRQRSHRSPAKESKSRSRRASDKSPHRSTSKPRHRSKSRRSTSRSRSRHHRDKYDDSRSHRRRSSRERQSRIDIDKKRLLEIARKNAITMLQTGSIPAQGQKSVIAALKCGGKSVDELTDFCKNLSRQEAIGELSSVSSHSEADEDDTGDAAVKPFVNPFTIKDRPKSIVLNIKGGTNLPTQSFQEKTIEQTKVLRQQFPVSSGSQHRGAETEWRPVSPPPPTPAHNSKSSTKFMGMSSDKINYNAHSSLYDPSSSSQSTAPSVNQANTLPVPAGPQVFPIPEPSMDIGSIVSQRLTAIRRLQQNPNDALAMSQMQQAQQEMSKWAQSKQEPGQFTGSTGAQILTPKELASGYQAWARRDQLQTAAPVNSGMGMHLLQKMGWKPGEGLGKQKNGALTPLLLEVKLDTRGLVAKEETRQRPNSKRPYVPTVKTLAGKHPVSLLGEYCSKRKLGVPSYNLCFECGPDHKKNFLFKVTVNGVEYQPSVASANKKQAKADAATVCLQKLGLMQ